MVPADKSVDDRYLMLNYFILDFHSNNALNIMAKLGSTGLDCEASAVFNWDIINYIYCNATSCVVPNL